MKNPVFAWILHNIFLTLILSIIGSAVYSGITSRSAKIKDIPSKDGIVINHIDINREVTIVNECSYYYEVVIINSDEQEIHGWVAKRNISVTDSSSSKNDIDE